MIKAGNFVYIFLFLFFSIFLRGNGMTLKLYVSSNGNDANNGNVSTPLASLDEAIMRAQKLQSSSRNSIDVEIIVASGYYSLKKPLLISAVNNKSKLTIRGAGMGNTILSGGLVLPSFHVDKETGLWIIDIGKELPIPEVMYQLFVNGHRATLARTPNAESFIVPIKATEKDSDVKSLYVQDIFLPNVTRAILQKIKQPNDVFVSILHYWDLSRRQLISFNLENPSLSVMGTSLKRWQYFTLRKRTQLYLENDFSFIDQPGEFYYDRIKRKIYYFPREGEKIRSTKAIVPTLNQLLTINGTNNNYAKNIKIIGITFAYSNYFVPKWGENPQQAVASKDAAIMLSFASNVLIEDCEISHTGTYGIWMKTACSDCSVERCLFKDLGAGGIKIGVQDEIKTTDPFLTKKIVVNNNIICEGGRVLAPGVGVLLLKASDCKITHNDIFDFYYSGISVGWVWGFADSPSKRNIISYNHIHHIGWGALSDMGGIYTLGVSEKTELTNNVIHDVYAYGHCGNGIYLDEGSSHILVKNNLVFNCKSAGFFQHYGKDNMVVNNIFINNYEGQMGSGKRVDDTNTLTFKSNIVSVSDNGRLFGDSNWGNVNYDSDFNLYWQDGGNTDFFENTNINKWSKAKSKDYHSLVGNPGIEKNQYTYIKVTNKKLYKKISFIPVDFSDVGVYGNVNWKNKAIMDKKRILLFDKIINYYENE